MDRARKNLEQAKARYDAERRKQNAKRRKAENHHKYMMGGIVAKYFPECDLSAGMDACVHSPDKSTTEPSGSGVYEQSELEIILKAAIGSAEFHVNVEWMKQRELEKQQASTASRVPETYHDSAERYMEEAGDGYSDGQESSDGGYAGYSYEATEDGSYGREW